jgi:Raf kinase inhibitor-like YbhB/YbcL family protein
MLQHLPKAVGSLLQNVRAGEQKLLIHAEELPAPLSIRVESSAFGDAQQIPVKYTADGEGLSPPLRWTGAPSGTQCVALIIEDADAPTAQPLVHLIAPCLPAGGELQEGALSRGTATGLNSFLMHGYVPPDPPPGHGVHRYAFELFALNETPEKPDLYGRGDLINWMRGKVLAKGYLVGLYERP